jgi:hypothetical protein
MKLVIAAVVNLVASIIILVQSLSSWWKGSVFVALDHVTSLISNENLYSLSGLPTMLLLLGVILIPIINVLTTVWSLTC